MNIIFKPECKTEIIEPTYDLPIIGEPISKTGASANNSNAYGVIVGIIGDGSSRRVRVMTEGYIDYDKVKENYMEYTDEAINALTGITLCSGGKLPTGVHPDWNQNDNTQPDYVKNRPFYTGDPVETVLVEESTVTFAQNSGLYVAKFQSTFEATVGEIYKVYWDGTVYECVCVNLNGYTIIGNTSILGGGSDTGEPFLMLVSNGTGAEIYTTNTSASHTFSINGFVTEVVKIDEKYLPVASDNNYGIVKKSEIASYYYFANSVPHDLMIEAVTTNAIIMWYGSMILRAYNSGDSVYIVFATNPFVRYIYKANENGVYTKDSGVVDTRESCSVGGIVTYDRSTGASCTLDASGEESDVAFKIGAKHLYLGSYEILNQNELYLNSSTANSTKKFKITVDDSGTLTATEIV